MDEFEKRMQKASEEVRDATRLITPPPRRGPVTSATTRWLAFAAGAAAVVLAVVLLPGFLAPVAGPDTTQPVATTLPGEPTTTITEPQVDCSSAGIPEPTLPDGLPQAVSARWHAVVRAAMSCDFDQLERVAASGFRTDFGGGGIEQFREWENAGEGKLGILLQLMNMSWGVQEITEPGYPDYYVWPSAFIYDKWEEIPQAALDEIRAI